MSSQKVVVLFTPAGGNTPQLKQRKFKLSKGTVFASVSSFLRKQLKLGSGDDLFLFIDGIFQPAPDQTIASLSDCFASGSQLVINYCTTPAWG
jgi:ubiquitin-like protein ATG12